MRSIRCNPLLGHTHSSAHSLVRARVRDTKRRGRETAGAIDGFVDPTSSTSASTVSTRRLPSSRRCGLCAVQAASRVTWCGGAGGSVLSAPGVRGRAGARRGRHTERVSISLPGQDRGDLGPRS